MWIYPQTAAFGGGRSLQRRQAGILIVLRVDPRQPAFHLGAVDIDAGARHERDGAAVAVGADDP